MRRALLFLPLAGCELLFQPRLREEAADASPPSDGGPPNEAGLTDVAPTKSCPTPLTCNGESCCATDRVQGGMFYRSYDGVTFNDMSFPAKVNAFGLDRYEVTVGRFKPFVDKYDPNQLQRGDGRQLPPSKQDLVDSLTKCGGTPGATWGGADELPINCVSWPVAFAFCAWDGGRLPTEAEWNFAAAGGTDQRVYPWSFPPDASDISDTRAVYSVGAPAAVGSKPGGKGRFGQYDLAGNVAEWVRDGYAAYIMPCDNCAQSTQAQNSVRGGAFGDGPTSLTASVRGAEDPLHTTPNIGLRCARD